jgi:hypothetical protein
MMKNRGITLVDLLALLVAATLLLCALIAGCGESRRQEFARRAICKTNLKSFVNAFIIYEDVFGSYPSLGNKDKELAAAPPKRFATLGDMASNADSRHCNIQPLYLLHTYSGMELGQFGCPSDEEFQSLQEHGNFDSEKFGFLDWHNVSYAIPPTSSAYTCGLNRMNPGLGLYMVGDRPQRGSLGKGSANHEDGSHFLDYSGSVAFEPDNTHPVEGQGKNVYLLDVPEQERAEKEIFLHYHDDNVQ